MIHDTYKHTHTHILNNNKSYCAYGVVVSMFDFHHSDWGSNPSLGETQDYNNNNNNNNIYFSHKNRSMAFGLLAIKH